MNRSRYTILPVLLFVFGLAPSLADNENENSTAASRDVYGHPAGTNVQGSANDKDVQGNRPKDAQGNVPKDIYGNKVGTDNK